MFGALVVMALIGMVWLAVALMERHWSRQAKLERDHLDQTMRGVLATRAASDANWNWETISADLGAKLVTFFEELSTGEISRSREFVCANFLDLQIDDLRECARKGKAYATAIRRIKRMIPMGIDEGNGELPLLNVWVLCEFDFHLEDVQFNRRNGTVSGRADHMNAEMYVVLQLLKGRWWIWSLQRFDQVVDEMLAHEKRIAKSDN